MEKGRGSEFFRNALYIYKTQVNLFFDYTTPFKKYMKKIDIFKFIKIHITSHTFTFSQIDWIETELTPILTLPLWSVEREMGQKQPPVSSLFIQPTEQRGLLSLLRPYWFSPLWARERKRERVDWLVQNGWPQNKWCFEVAGSYSGGRNTGLGSGSQAGVDNAGQWKKRSRGQLEMNPTKPQQLLSLPCFFWQRKAQSAPPSTI